MSFPSQIFVRTYTSQISHAPFSSSSSPLPSLSPSTGPNTHGVLSSKVAVITDTNYTPRLVPLILHFHSVLGPDWPIIFFTSAKTRAEHFTWNSETGNNTGSAIWQRAVEDRKIEIRTLPNDVDVTTRLGVNLYLSRPVREVSRGYLNVQRDKLMRESGSGSNWRLPNTCFFSRYVMFTCSSVQVLGSRMSFLASVKDSEQNSVVPSAIPPHTHAPTLPSNHPASSVMYHDPWILLNSH